MSDLYMKNHKLYFVYKSYHFKSKDRYSEHEKWNIYMYVHIYNKNTNLKRGNVALLILDKIDFKTKSITGYNEGFFKW